MDLSVYSLFLVDIMMDKLSGFDFAKRVRNVTETEETPMLFCSALSGEDFVVKGLNIGADDYVTKPFVIGEVLARVRAVLRRAGATAKRSASDIIEQESIYESDVTFRDLRIDRNDKECYPRAKNFRLHAPSSTFCSSSSRTATAYIPAKK